jgi:hypothetical protein
MAYCCSVGLRKLRMDCIVSRISAMPWLRSTMATVVYSGVKTARGAAGAPIGREGFGTSADVDVAAWSGAVVPGGSVAASGGTVVVGRGIDVAKSDTRLIRTWTLPLVDRRLYECEVAGRGLGAAARRRGAVVACERKGRQRWRLGQSRLPREAE